MSVLLVPFSMIDEKSSGHWPALFERLVSSGRAQKIPQTIGECWVATERVALVEALWSDDSSSEKREDAVRNCVQGWIQIMGPVTANRFANCFSLDPRLVLRAFLSLENQGLLMRGSFEAAPVVSELDIEWCERRILQRIHKLTVGIRRRQIEPVSASAFLRWLLDWQHLAPQTQVTGEDGLLEAISKLEGFEAPAVEWERTIFPSRVANYDPRWLDQLCLSGAVGWGRVSPHPAFHEGNGNGPQRVIPTSAAPITFYLRDSAAWMDYALREHAVDDAKLTRALTPNALRIWEFQKKRGACFAEEVERGMGLSSIEVRQALWELAAAGLACADGFDQLRSMIDPDRRRAANHSYRKVRSAAGRWSLFRNGSALPEDAIEQARFTDIAIESAARMLLNRYGVLFRDLLGLETNIPRWGVLLRMLRRLEDRGEVRGGRFISGFSGEQFALPEVVDSLRSSRRQELWADVTVAGADPLNLIGILIPGERVAAVPGRNFVLTKEILAGSGPLASRLTERRRSRESTQPLSPRNELKDASLFRASMNAAAYD